MFWSKKPAVKSVEEKTAEFFAYADEIKLAVSDWKFFAMGEDKMGHHIQLYARKRDNNDPTDWVRRVKTKLSVLNEASLSLKGYDADKDYRSIELVFKDYEANKFMQYVEKAIQHAATARYRS